jgi:hypothetical protein
MRALRGGTVTVTAVNAMRATEGTATRRPHGRAPLCTDRVVDLLRVNSALCSATCRALPRG